MKLFIRISDALSHAGGLLAMALLAAAVLVVCEVIIVRYFLRWSAVWQTEFVIYALVAATFIGSPYVLLQKAHVCVDLLPNALGGRGKFWLNILASLISLSFCLVLAGSGLYHFLEAWNGAWTTDTVWALPLWIALLPLPLGMGLMCTQYVAEIAKLTKWHSS